MKEEKTMVEGWQVAPEEVRQIATKMDIPSDVPLPEVVVMGKDEPEDYQKAPQINEGTSGLSPSGYFITIPESMLERVTEKDYILGARDKMQNIRHELAHYMDYREGGSTAGRYSDAYAQAVKEVRADLRGGVRNLPLALSRQAIGLACDYDLSDEEALRTVTRAARSLGIENHTISRAKSLYYASIKDFRQ